MKRFIDNYHLKTGFIAAILFPGVFIFSKSDLTYLFNRFILSFICIFSLWVINFVLIDFKKNRQSNIKRSITGKFARIVLSFIIAIGFNLFVGFFIDKTGNFLSQIRGELVYSFRAWFFLCLRLSIFNAVIILIKYLFDTYEVTQRIEMENEKLKRENLLAVHESLKQQMSPHFLFNSFNTLRSLVKQDAAQSVKFIDELSSVYRYMLVHNNKNIVLLKEELDFLQSYLYLLKIRFGDAICIKIKIPDEASGNTIPPNTLQLLIENAVKHNSHSLKKPLVICLLIENNYLVIENNLQPVVKQKSISNFGLSNINTRYILQKEKNIIIQQDSNRFRVLLPLN